jgi:hypothetical protein
MATVKPELKQSDQATIDWPISAGVVSLDSLRRAIRDDRLDRGHLKVLAYLGECLKPPRSAGGHRLYAEEYERRLVFVRRARELGFSLEDVRALLRLTGGRDKACGKAKGITEKHIAEIRWKVNELKRLERVLSNHGHPVLWGRHVGLPNP